MILVLNCGSQSVKWKVFDKDLKTISFAKKEYFNKKESRKVLERELKKIKKKKIKIGYVCHRVVHGGRYFQPTIIRKDVLKEIEKFSEIAPLHNPFEFLGIKISQKVFEKAKQIAVFDTGFFSSLPEVAKIYPLPKEIRRKYLLQKFGFHGISHKYLLLKSSEILKKPVNKINLITLHLGGGSSIVAIKNGQPIETSMGFSPLDGLLMTTRPGQIDPGLVLFLAKRIGPKETERILNFESGIKAIAGTSNFKKVLESRKKESKLAIEIFVWQIKKFISAYWGLLGGKIDALVFSGSIGSGMKKTRDLILKDLNFLKETKILVLETDEAYQIAREVKEKWLL